MVTGWTSSVWCSRCSASDSTAAGEFQSGGMYGNWLRVLLPQHPQQVFCSEGTAAQGVPLLLSMMAPKAYTQVLFAGA
jgi:hypothetical protein